MADIRTNDTPADSSGEQSTSTGISLIQSGSRTLPSLMDSLNLVDPISEIMFNRNTLEPSINDRQGRALWNDVHNDFDVLIAQSAYNSAKFAYQQKICEATRKRFDARYRKGATTAPSRALPSRVRQTGPSLPPLRSPTSPICPSPSGSVNDIGVPKHSRSAGAMLSPHGSSAMQQGAPPMDAVPEDPSVRVHPPFTPPPGMAWKLVPLHRMRARVSPQPPSRNRDVRNAP